MRAKRSIFDSTRLRYSSVFCSVASRVVTNNLYVYINASSCSRRFYVVGRSRRFVGHAASTQNNPTRAYPRGVARTSSHTPHFLFPCSNSLSFCHKAHPVRVRDDVLLVLDVRAVCAYSKQRAPRASHARVRVIASAKHHGALRHGHEVRHLGRVHGYRLRHVTRAARRQRHAAVVERDDHRDVLMAGTLLPVEIRVPVLALRLALALRGVAIDDARAASVAALLQPAQEPPLARRPRASARRRSTDGTDARSRALPRARSRRASSDSSFTPRPSLRARRSRVGVDDFSTDRLHPCVREAPLEHGVALFGRIEHDRTV